MGVSGCERRDLKPRLTSWFLPCVGIASTAGSTATGRFQMRDCLNLKEESSLVSMIHHEAPNLPSLPASAFCPFSVIENGDGAPPPLRQAHQSPGCQVHCPAYLDKTPIIRDPWGVGLTAPYTAKAAFHTSASPSELDGCKLLFLAVLPTSWPSALQFLI